MDSGTRRNGLSEADLDIPAKLSQQRLERGEEAEALPRREIVAEDDLLQLGVAEGIEVEVPGRSRRSRPFAFSTAPFRHDAYASRNQVVTAQALASRPCRANAVSLSKVTDERSRGSSRRNTAIMTATVSARPRTRRRDGRRGRGRSGSCAP